MRGASIKDRQKQKRYIGGLIAGLSASIMFTACAATPQANPQALLKTATSTSCEQPLILPISGERPVGAAAQEIIETATINPDTGEPVKIMCGPLWGVKEDVCVNALGYGEALCFRDFEDLFNLQLNIAQSLVLKCKQMLGRVGALTFGIVRC